MRKLKTFLTVLALFAVFSMSVLAAGAELKIPSVSGREGETVYLNLSLSEAVTGDSMRVDFEYDTKLLELIPSACSWGPKAVLKDFGSYGDSGVWAGSAAQSIRDGICVLALRIREGTGFSGTQVKVTLTVKNGSETVGTFTATCQIDGKCDHSYGQWSDMGGAGHSRTCTLCGGSQTQSHEWGETRREPDPEKEGYELAKRSCAVCGAEQTEQVKTSPEQDADLPMATEGTWTPPEPPTAPREDDRDPTYYTVPDPTQPRPTDPPVPTEPEQDRPHYTEPEEGQTHYTQPPHDHDRDQSTQNQGDRNPGSQNQGSQNQGSQNPGSSQENPTEPTGTTEEEFHVHVGEDGQYIIHQGSEHEDPENLPQVAPTISPELKEQLEQIQQQQEEAERAKRTEGALAIALGLAAMAAGVWWYLKRRRK